jgi:hypothetical protein
MKLLRLDGSIYALVSYRDISVSGNTVASYRLYKLTSRDAQLVCDSDELLIIER